MLSKTERGRLHDTLNSSKHKLKVADSACFILWDKAHYFVQMCEGTSNYIDRAQKDYKELREMLAAEQEE